LALAEYGIPLTDCLPSGGSAGTFFATRTSGGVTWVHAGQDYYTKSADITIYAVKAGMVIGEGWHDQMGWHVVTGAYDGGIIRYMHMAQRSSVRIGWTIVQGQALGPMGSTGFSTGPHLHLDIAFMTVAQAVAELMSFGYSEGEALASVYWRINNAFIDPVKVIGVEVVPPTIPPKEDDDMKRIVLVRTPEGNQWIMDLERSTAIYLDEMTREIMEAEKAAGKLEIVTYTKPQSAIDAIISSRP
jgi:hypothetical protein